MLLALIPAVAQAAQTPGPASFARAGAKPIVVPLGAGGVTIYPTSPAYIVMPVSARTQALERYASTHNFSSVGVRDIRGGQTGQDCFVDAHPIVAPSFISDFKLGGHEYHGLLMQYAKMFFLAGERNPARCGVVNSAGPVMPSIILGAKTANLTLDCLARTCRGSFAAFAPASSCSSPISLPPGVRGCLPENTGSFELVGGLSGGFNLKLFGRSARSTQFALFVNGKRRVLGPLSALLRTQRPPQRPRKASLSIACTDAPVGGQTTVSGLLSPSGARTQLTLTFTGPGGATTTLPAAVAPNGRYSDRLTPSAPGAWTVTATFAGDRSRRATSSRPCHLAVAPTGTH